MVNANEYNALYDSDIFETAIKNRTADGIVVIEPRVQDNEPERNFWLIDRAILLPENTTVILKNCTIKLSDKCRDNFFRTANCGFGIELPEQISNVHIIGEGLCVLQGADHPRSTGDSTKILANPCPYEAEDLLRLADWLSEEEKTTKNIEFWSRHNHSYGTDAGKKCESQFGDWRNIGILFANTKNFSIKNVKIIESHGWGISLEECSFGTIKNIEFDACMSKKIDSLRQNIENEDGIDVRNGCHDIIIEDIFGRTGDDVIALTAITEDQYIPGGSLHYHVMHNDWSKRDKNIHDIIIRNVIAHSHLCWVVRLLPARTKIWNVVIDNIIDNTPDNQTHAGTLILGDGCYGENYKDGLSGISISNVISNCNEAITLVEYLKDSSVSNIISRRPGARIINANRPDALINVKTENLVITE